MLRTTYVIFKTIFLTLCEENRTKVRSRNLHKLLTL